MQIGALGFVNTVRSQFDEGQANTNQNNNFARLLSGLTEDIKVGNNVPLVNEVTKQLTKEDLSKLIQFLSSTELSKSELGFEIMKLQVFNKDISMTDLMKETMQLTDEEVISAITYFLKDLDVKKIGEFTSLSSEEEFSKIAEELPQMDVNNAMITFISILPFIHLDEMTLKTDQNVVDVAKSLKLFELLSNEPKTNVNQLQLQDFLQKVIEKLETTMKEVTHSNQNEYLKKVYTPMVKVSNGQTLKSQPFQFTLLPELSESELGTEMMELQVVNKDSSMADLMKETMQLTDEEGISAITSFLKDFDIKKVDDSTSSSEEEFDKNAEELPLMDVNNAMNIFISILPFIHLDEMILKTDPNVADVAKALKLFELLSNEPKTNVNKQLLQGFLQKVIKKLETSLKEGTHSNQNEYLKMVYTPMVKVSNGQTLKSQPFQSTLLPELSESELGTEMMELQVVNKDSSMADLMKETMQLTDEEGISAITSFLKDFDIKKVDDSTSSSEEEFDKNAEELPLMDVNNAMNIFISILPFIHLDEMILKTDPNVADVAKALKLFELLSNEPKTNVNKQLLQDFLQKVIKKLETSLKEGTLSNKNEYLHKVFTPMVKVSNGQTLKSQPFQSTLSPDQFSTKIENENIEVSQTNTLNGKILPFQQISKPYELTLTQSQSGNKVSTEQLIQQFESILSKSQLLNTGGNQKLFIKLHPEHLGAIRVELIQKESALIAKFMTTTANAKDILESQLQSLKQAFSTQNIQIEKIEISQQLNQQERYFNRDSQQQQEQKQQREQDEPKQKHNSSLTLSFEDELLNVEV